MKRIILSGLFAAGREFAASLGRRCAAGARAGTCRSGLPARRAVDHQPGSTVVYRRGHAA